MVELESVACNLCGSAQSRLKYREKYRDGTYSIVRCSRCGLAYVNPRPAHCGSFDEVSAEEEDGLARSKRVRYYRRWLDELKAVKGGGRLLDIGCGTGVFLELVRECTDFRAEGLEITKQFVEICRRKGLVVSEGMLESDSLPGRGFDVVTMWDVLEHLRDPRGALMKVRDHCARDGVLVVKVPNIRSLNLSAARVLLRARRREMFVRDHPLRHLYHFSPGTLGAMLSSAGFRAVKRVTEESAFSTLSASGVRAAVKKLIRHTLGTLPLGLNDEIVVLAVRR